MNKFVGLMLWREVRSSWSRLLLFLLCITAGVGGLVAVKSFSYNLRQAIAGEARSLMAADLILRSRQPFTVLERSFLAELIARGAEVVHSRQLISMARSSASERVHLITVRSVGEGYPFYGSVLTRSGRPFRELLNDRSVLAHNALLIKMGLAVGDSIEVGDQSFQIAGVLVQEPDSPVQAFNLGPRVLMTEGGGDATGLFSLISRVRYSALVRMPPGIDPEGVARDFRSRYPESFTGVETFEGVRPRAGRFLGRLADFLNLVGLAALLLGGIGVSGAVRAFMAQKMDTLAVLKCLGASTRQLFSIYLLLALLIGLAGSGLGVVLGFATQWALPRLLSDLLPVSVVIQWPWSAAAEGVLIGGLTTLWFSLPALMSVRGVPPARVFRRNVEPPPAGRLAWLRTLITPASLLVLAGVLSVWQAGFSKTAGLFMLGLGGAIFGLHLASVGLLLLLRWAPKPAGFQLRQGLAGLYRPGNQTAPVVMSLGLGVLILLSVFLIQRDLLQQVAANSPQDQPNLFFVDIQPDQRETFTGVLENLGHKPMGLIPIVRGRVVAIKGRPIVPGRETDDHERRHLRFEYAFTYRDHLAEGESVIAGRFALDPNIPGAQVSLASWFAENSDLEVGDTLTVDVQGVRVTAVVTSIRSINWVNRRANFSFVFLPGALEQAPAIYASAVRVTGERARVILQREVVNAMPNVTGIDVDMIFRIVQGFMDRIAMVIRFMAGFCIAVGLVILVGAIATTKYQRIREAVLLKTLGATRGEVAAVLTLEYALMGAMAGTVGAIAAGGFYWSLVTHLFQVSWNFSPGAYLVTIAAAVGLIAATGLGGSVDVLLKKPLEVLREE